MRTLPERVAGTIAAHRMISPGQTVLVALSGGPDSTALLHALGELGPRLDFGLCACHVHHGIRGRDADADAECARAQAGAQGIPFMLERADVRAYARGRRLSLETAAREVRYDLLAQAAEALGADRIATGHTADDLAETVLMNLLRGSGPAGLAGIPPVRERIVRPLLEVSRAEVEQYCAAEGLAFRVDRSNEDRDFFRNRVRHEVVPLLRRLQPRAAEALARLAQVMRDEDAYMDVEAAAALASVGSGEPTPGERRIELAAFCELHEALQRRVARMAVAGVKGDDRDLTLERVEALVDLARRGRTGAGVELPGGLRAERRYGTLVIRWARPRARRAVVARPLSVPGALTVEEIGVTLSARRSRAKRPPSDPNVALLDAARMEEPLVVRTRRRGDRFTPLGMEGSVKLQDFFVNEKVPRAERGRVPLVVCGGTIAWVVGRRIGEEFKVTAQTRRTIRLEARWLPAPRTTGGE